MPPLNPPPSRHAGALDAKIHKLASGFGQYEFWPRPPLACRAADKAGTHYPADCNVRAGFSAHRRMVETLRAAAPVVETARRCNTPHKAAQDAASSAA